MNLQRIPSKRTRKQQKPSLSCQLLQRPFFCCSWRGMTVLFGLLVGINWQTGKHLTTELAQQIMLDYPWPQNTTIRQTQAIINVHKNTSNDAKVSKAMIQPSKVDTLPLALKQEQSGVNSSVTALAQEDEETSVLLTSWQNTSSVDYFGCCGAGHRLSRTANAYWLARHVLNFGLRVYWRFCGSIEVFNALFHPQPLEELQNVTSMNQNIYFHNEIPGFVTLHRRQDKHHKTTKRSCQCTPEKIQSDAEFYNSLRQRYRFKKNIDEFVEQHFREASLRIGLHIRAGNNETGDFTIKARNIERIDEWVQHVARHILTLVDTWTTSQQHPPSAGIPRKVLVYVASDTPSMLFRFRSLLTDNSTMSNEANYSIRVIEYPQGRLKEGAGVLFGESQADHMGDGTECLQSWQSIFADLMLLSHVDILVAPRSSSFTQTLPMSLVFAHRLEQQQQGNSSGSLPPAFCEMNRNASSMYCYDTFLQWCCDSVSEQVGVHFPVPGKRFKLVPVPREETCLPVPERSARPGYCLPFRWPKEMQKQRPIRRHRGRVKKG